MGSAAIIYPNIHIDTKARASRWLKCLTIDETKRNESTIHVFMCLRAMFKFRIVEKTTWLSNRVHERRRNVKIGVRACVREKCACLCRRRRALRTRIHIDTRNGHGSDRNAIYRDEIECIKVAKRIYVSVIARKISCTRCPCYKYTNTHTAQAKQLETKRHRGRASEKKTTKIKRKNVCLR